MNEMQVFQNSEFGELGVLELEGKPYCDCVGTDLICASTVVMRVRSSSNSF